MDEVALTMVAETVAVAGLMTAVVGLAVHAGRVLL